MAIEIVDLPIKNGGSFHSYLIHTMMASLIGHRSKAAPSYFPAAGGGAEARLTRPR